MISRYNLQLLLAQLLLAQITNHLSVANKNTIFQFQKSFSPFQPEFF